MKKQSIKRRIIRDQLGAFDIAIVYYDRNRPVAFKRYRPTVEARATKKEFDQQLHITQHIYAEALRFGIIDVLKQNIEEL